MSARGKKGTSRKPDVADESPRSPWRETMAPTLVVAGVVVTTLITSDGPTDDGLFVWGALLWAMIAVVLTAGIYLERSAWRQLSRSDALNWDLLDIAVAAWLVWQAASTALVMGRGNLRAGVNSLGQSIALAIAFWSVRFVMRSSEMRRALVAAMFGTCVGLAAFGVVQRYVVQPALVAEFKRNPEAALGSEAHKYPPDSPERIQLENRLAATEPTTTFALTNSLAGVLAPWLLVVLFPAIAAVARFDWRCEDVVWRTLAVVATVAGIALISFCLLLTKSRTAILATLAVAAVASIGLAGSWGRRAAWLAVGLAAVGAGVVGGLLAIGAWDVQVLSEAPKSLLYRVEYWQATSQMIADHVLFGVGPGNFQAAYPRYKLAQASETVGDPHNFLFEIAATTGVPGLLIVLAILGIALWPRSSRPVSAESPFALEPRDGMFVALVATAIGWIVAAPLSWLSGIGGIFVPRLDLPAVWVVGLPAALVGAAGANTALPKGEALDQWVRAGVAGSIVNWCAAGGWSFPSVAVGFWALLAIDAARRDGARKDVVFLSSSPSRPWQFVPLVAAFLAALGAAWGLVAPVTGARLAFESAVQAMSAGKTSQALEWAEKSESADPWSPQGAIAVAQAQAIRHELAAAESALDRHIARNRRAFHGRLQAGHVLLGFYRDTSDAEWLAKAVARYREAVERYPNNARVNAQLAIALAGSGNMREAGSVAETALALDEKNPHREQKLVQQRLDKQDLVWPWPTGTAPGFLGKAGLSEGIDAEQAMRIVRKYARGEDAASVD